MTCTLLPMNRLFGAPGVPSGSLGPLSLRSSCDRGTGRAPIGSWPQCAVIHSPPFHEFGLVPALRRPNARVHMNLWLFFAFYVCGYSSGWTQTASSTANSLLNPQVYFGLCDASAMETVGKDYFAVADDEDNRIRIYHQAHGEGPVSMLDVSPFLRVDPKSPEVDIEGAARLGDRIFWIASHGRMADGKPASSRQRLFATSTGASNGIAYLQLEGQPYSGLLSNLVADARLAPYNLAEASMKPPKSPGALNIEGLAATPEGHLLIGFRNPIPMGKALIVPLLNPADVIAGSTARLGDPLLIDLDGRGIRSITFQDNHYLIIAGSFQEGGGQSRLYRWNGGNNQPVWLQDIDFGGLNFEAITIAKEEGAAHLYLASDDGALKKGKTKGKKVKGQSKKRFRVVRFAQS